MIVRRRMSGIGWRWNWRRRMSGMRSRIGWRGNRRSVKLISCLVIIVTEGIQGRFNGGLGVL
jgi:hypothetical protein